MGILGLGLLGLIGIILFIVFLVAMAVFCIIFAIKRAKWALITGIVVSAVFVLSTGLFAAGIARKGVDVVREKRENIVADQQLDRLRQQGPFSNRQCPGIGDRIRKSQELKNGIPLEIHKEFAEELQELKGLPDEIRERIEENGTVDLDIDIVVKIDGEEYKPDVE